MAVPGSIGSQMPPGEDALVRKIADLERSMRELAPSVAASFASTVAELQEQTTYLASLKTKSATAPDFTVNPIPGDGVQRFVDSNAVIYLAAPTGRVLVTIGAGLVDVSPGDLSAQMGVTFNVTTEGDASPFYVSGVRQARVFSTVGDKDSHSVCAVVPVTVSPVGVSKFVMAFSSLSTSLTTAAAGDVYSPYMIVQVIPAED